MTDDGKPVRAAAYQRISEILRFGDEHGVANQKADQERVAAARGYQIVMSEADNDISAFTGKRRPGYERIMAAAAAGMIDVILVFQTSRFWRNRRERAEAIDILKKAGVSIIATRGPSLDMSTAYGRMMAGLLGEFDTGESEIKSERQIFANESAATAGQARNACPRPFGWQRDRLTRDLAEAEAVADACRMLLTGATISDVALDWERRGLRPHQAPFGPLPEHPWTRTSIRQILKNPRNAGISAYKGIEVAAGEWEPLVDEPTYREVGRLLSDSSKQWPRGAVTLLGGLALCRCGNTAGASSSANGRPAYRCIQATRNGRAGPHVQVIAGPVDDAVTRLVIARLSEPGAVAALMIEPAREDLTALRDEETTVRARLARLGEMYADGVISDQDLITGRARGEQRLTEIRGQLAGHSADTVLTPLLAARSAAAEWDRLTIAQRRTVVSTLMTVVLHPSGRGARTFDPGKVLEIRWKADG